MAEYYRREELYSMKQISNGTLPPRLRELGFELVEDDHIIELKCKGEAVAGFSTTGTTAEEICKEAERWLKTQQTK